MECTEQRGEKREREEDAGKVEAKEEHKICMKERKKIKKVPKVTHAFKKDDRVVVREDAGGHTGYTFGVVTKATPHKVHVEFYEPLTLQKYSDGGGSQSLKTCDFIVRMDDRDVYM